MNETVIAGVLSAVATVFATRVVQSLWSRRSNGNGGNGRGAGNGVDLRAEREMANLVSTVRSLLKRVADLETWRDDQAD